MSRRAMWLWVVALAIACFLVGPSRAEEPTKPQDFTVRVIQCGPVLCTVVGVDLAALAQSNNVNYERAVKAEAELAKVREIKGCGKLEVTEPPRNFVPRKERDS